MESFIDRLRLYPCHTSQKSVDWSSLGISFFVEYNDVCGLEKVCSIKPHILILGKLMFSNVDELAKNLYQQNAQAKLIFVGSNRKWKETEYTIWVHSCCQKRNSIRNISNVCVSSFQIWKKIELN